MRHGFSVLSAWAAGGTVALGVLFALAGCSHRASGGGAGSEPWTPGAPVPSHTTISVAEAAPKAGAPAWCRTIDDPAVAALADALPQLVTDKAADAAPKVHSAAAVLRKAAAAAPAGPGKLLTTAAASLDAAATAKSAGSLEAVGTAFASLSKGVQGTCGFH